MSDSNPAASNPYAPPQTDVSPLAPPAGLAGRGQRLAAVILDGIVSSAMYYVPFLVLGGGSSFAAVVAAAGRGQRTSPLALYSGAGTAALSAMLIGFVVWAAITIVLVRRNGQTIAKKMLGIKVVRSDGSKASLGRIFWLRNVVSLILSVIPLIGLVYFLVDTLLIFGEPRRCLHDRIADTIVVTA